jgi:hypothetical protein
VINPETGTVLKSGQFANVWNGICSLKVNPNRRELKGLSQLSAKSNPEISEHSLRAMVNEKQKS